MTKPTADGILVPDHDDDARAALVIVNAAANRLASKYPFHAGILSRWTVVPNRFVRTAGVTARMEGVYLLVNPEFWASMSEDEQVGVLHHEVNHVLFGHIFVPHSKFKDRRARVVAEEVTVNEWVPEPLPGNPVVLSSYKGLPKGEDTDTRYIRLARMRKKRVARPMPGTLDDHGVWVDAVAAGEAARLAARLTVRAAAGQLGPGEWAKLPVALRVAVTGMHGDKAGTDIECLVGTGTGTVDWRGSLRRIVASDTRPAARYGRPPRRFPHLAGVVPGTGRAPERPRVLAVVDTSGSVSHAMLEDIAAELRAMSSACSVTVVECDTKVHDVYPFPVGGSMKQFKGRGGTDLRPPFAAAFLREHRADVVVYFTDGDGPAPDHAPVVPVYWCLTAGGHAPAKWGRVLKMRA